MATRDSDVHGPDDARATTPARVSLDPGVMGGTPCFAGTRVPASMVLGRVDSGEGWAQLVSDYPFLTEQHIAAAREFVAGHPDSNVMTEAEAATLLHVSPSHVRELVRTGAVESTASAAGAPLRLTGASVVKYRRIVKAQQTKSLDAMAAASERLGLYDEELKDIPVRKRD